MASNRERGSSYFPKGSFKTVDELRALREEKGNRSPDLLKASATNTLYYKASPLDDASLEKMLAFMDEFSNQQEAKNRTWVARGVEKHIKCDFGTSKKEPTIDEVRKSLGTSGSQDSTARKKLDNSDLLAYFRGSRRDSSKPVFVDDIAMENLLRAKADGVKEKIRVEKYKKHMKHFLKVYQLLKGGELDKNDALKMINAPQIREAASYGMRENKGMGSYWELSRLSFPIKMETFAVNRRRLLRELSRKYGKALVLLKGGEEIYLYDSSNKYKFCQEPFFLWTFGAMEPNLWGCLDCWTGKAILLTHRLSVENDEYQGQRKVCPVLSELKAKYEVDDVGYVDELQDIITRFTPSTLLVLEGVVPSPNNPFPQIEIDKDTEISTDCLHEILCNLRVNKTNFELDLIRYANKMSSLAHKLMMKRISADSYEYQAEALFQFFVHFVGGCSTLSYPPVCASGRNTCNPNYTSNTRLIKCDDLIIFDMGAVFYGYASSIACTIPAGGKFDLEQKTIYNIVLTTRNAALSVLKAGVYWSEVHENAMRTLLNGLSSIGILNGDVEKMLNAGVSNIFMPFGIGHLLGLDNFDVGGYTAEAPEKQNNPPHLAELKTLRCLKPGMVMTVQVGCYFQLQEILKANDLKPYLVKETLNRFLRVGGVYMKDNIAITHQGYEMMTDVPRTVEEVEDWIAGKHTDLSFEFGLEDKVKKDELWFGNRTNPCERGNQKE